MKERVVLQPIFELISGLAGLAFIISGTYNYFLFQRQFSLNYFVIAGPNDIVMSAFLIVILISILGVLYILFIAIFLFVSSKTDRIPRQWAFILPAAVIVLIAIMVAARASTREQTVVRWFNERFYLVDYTAPDLADSNCAQPRVRWLGENSLVYRCGDGRYRVLKGLASVKLVTSR